MGVAVRRARACPGRATGGTPPACVYAAFTMMKKLAMIAFLALGSITAMGSANATTCRPVYQCDPFGCYYIGDYCCDWFGCYFKQVW